MKDHIKKTIENGDTCPICGGDTVEGMGAANFIGNTVEYKVGCVDCDSIWVEIYKMVSIDIQYSKHTVKREELI